MTQASDETAVDDEGFSHGELQSLRRKLRQWYARQGRDLPWRVSRDPYQIWISEIMLQQTTVTAVKPYFERFLQRFPTFESLAAASEHDVLQLWEGLGYYSRARNIKKAAEQIVHEHGGQFPHDLQTLQSLSGIGRYTAGAIASFAFDLPAPIVEANTQRLYARLLAFPDQLTTARGQRTLWEFAEQLITRTRPGELNAALMDLGATVCRPVDPDCARCPLASLCRGRAAGLQNEIPPRKQRAIITELTDVSLAVLHQGRYLLRQRTAEERWAGLWDFPRYTLSDNEAAQVVVSQSRPNSGHSLFDDQVISAATRSRLERELREQTGIACHWGELLQVQRHSVTRYRIRLLCFAATKSGGRLPPNRKLVWVGPDEFANYPLSVTARKLANFLQSH